MLLYLEQYIILNWILSPIYFLLRCVTLRCSLARRLVRLPPLNEGILGGGENRLTGCLVLFGVSGCFTGVPNISY